MLAWRHTVKLGHVGKEVAIFWFILPQSVCGCSPNFQKHFQGAFFFIVGYYNYWIACVVRLPFIMTHIIHMVVIYI